MDSLIFELQIVFYFQLFLSANVRHRELNYFEMTEKPLREQSYLSFFQMKR